MAELLILIIIIYVVYIIFKGKKNNENESFKHKKESTKEKRGGQSEPDNRNDDEILGLSGEWTQKDLKDAYRFKCNQLHPDKWVKMPKQMGVMMEKEFKIVQQAYKNLLK